MLQEVGEPALAVSLVPGAHPVPHLKGYGRALRILKQKNLQTVFQGHFLDARPEREPGKRHQPGKEQN